MDDRRSDGYRSTPRRAVDGGGKPVDSTDSRIERKDPDKLSFGGHVIAFFKELTFVIVVAVVLASLLRGFVGQMFIIPSISMEDTLKRDDRVLVEKLTPTRRGEVVVFADPGGWLSGLPADEPGPVSRALQFVGVLPDTSTEHLIKRVVGLPGDRVVCCDAEERVTVNGSPLDERRYLPEGLDGEPVAPSMITFEVVVPADHIFVLGDNRPNSRDSRCHLNDAAPGGTKGQNGFVSEDLVVGRAVAVAWPWPRRHRLPIPDTFEGVPVGADPAPTTPKITAGPEANC